jgi:dihydroorotate dehydrogenase subfamily 2
MNRIIPSLTAAVYQQVLKPIFFLFDPELVHNQMVKTGSLIGRVSGLTTITGWCWNYTSPTLAKQIDGIRFPNPVGLSAGFDYNGNLTDILPAVGFGFHTIGTVTLESYDGNATPRLGRFPNSKALLVNKGLKNLGAKAIIAKLRSKTFQIPVGISIASTNRSFKNETEQIENIVTCFKLFEKSAVAHAYYELNISCPNTFGGEPFTTPEKLKRLMHKMDALHLKKPLYVKMPIDQGKNETLQLLEVLANSKVQGVIFGNLTKDRKNPDVAPADRLTWLEKKGNLSGKPTQHRSNSLIALTKKHYRKRFTIIGTGGIFSGPDAAEKMKLGADLVQLITGMIYQGPQLIGEINYYLDTTTTSE